MIILVFLTDEHVGFALPQMKMIYKLNGFDHAGTYESILLFNHCSRLFQCKNKHNCCLCLFRCRGTTKWVHQTCLQRWVDEKQRGNSTTKVSCPQCNTEYLILFPKLGKTSRNYLHGLLSENYK